MKNKYPGKCRYCGQPLGPNEGVSFRSGNLWVLYHEGCNRAYHASKKDQKLDAPHP